MRKPNPKTVRDAIRASVPDAKLRHAKIVLSDAPAGTHTIGGFTEYDTRGSQVVRLGAPTLDNSFGITVRGHETRHATRHKKTRKKPMTENEAIASQIVDDANIEQNSLPPEGTAGLRAYKRAHLTTALRDLRTMMKNARLVKAGLAPDNFSFRNGQLLCGTRVLSMLRSYGDRGKGNAEDKARQKAWRKLRDTVGLKTVRAIGDVVSMAKSSRNRARAISLLVGLMETEPEPFEEAPEEKPPTEGDILAPVVDGTGTESQMKITDLRPKTVFTAKEKQITRKYAPDGVSINPARYVNAIVSGESHGLFSRRFREKPGGVLLIDASGSMGANKYNLSALCALNPKATVAYYSGTGMGRGELCVYAFQGKRFAGELPRETIHGGNAVDRPAIQWMMRLPKPWVLVSDLEFCGGMLGDEPLAHALVERATQRGDLTVHHSLDAAYAAFGGKGDMPNESRRERGTEEAKQNRKELESVASFIASRMRSRTEKESKEDK